MAPLIPIVIAGASLLAYKKAKKKKGVTPERKKIFESAIKSLSDPVKLRALAASFDKEGLKAMGNELRKRAALREMPPEKQTARKEAYKKAIEHKDPAKVLKVAQAFHAEGAYGAAQNLRDYAKGISEKTLHIFSHPAATQPPPTPPIPVIPGAEEE